MVVLLMFLVVNKVVTLNVSILDNVSEKKEILFNCSIYYFNLDDLNLPNGILYSRSCPSGLLYNAADDRCDYPSVVQC